MKNVLIISGHPDLSCSYANKHILDEIKKSIPQVEISYLDQLYADFNIDVPAEQAKLRNADIIVWQFPFYWFSVPDLMKRWIDQVLTHGFAYGSAGTCLHGKKAIMSITIGGDESSYINDNPSVSDYILPLKQSVQFCGMDYVDNIVSTGMMYVENVSMPEKMTLLQENTKKHAQQVIDVVSRLMAE